MLQLQLSTIIFQIINFFLLLAGLTYFLYRPLLRVMGQREEAIANRLRDADERTKRAEIERSQLAEERKQAQQTAEQILVNARAEATSERAKLLEAARVDANAQIATTTRQIAEQERRALNDMEERVTDSAISVAGQLVRRVAGPEMHQALLERLLGDAFRNLGSDVAANLHGISGKGIPVTVQLAYPPPEDLKARLTAAVAPALGGDLAHPPIQFQVEPSLIAGARLLAGTIVVDLSLTRMLDDLRQSKSDVTASTEETKQAWIGTKSSPRP